jgi:hypothetical protein
LANRTGQRAPRRWRDLHWSTKLCLLATGLGLLLAGAEVSARLYWMLGRKTPFFGTQRIWRTYFPEVAESLVDQAPAARRDAPFAVLVLGPSVWHPFFGDLGARLEKGLAHKLGRPVRVYNASYPTRNSRDALVLYRHLADHRFHLVLVYHGINDAAMNNCPASLYRNDYTHVARYKSLQLLEHHPEHPWLAFPFTLLDHFNRGAMKFGLVDEASLKYIELGNEVKTPPAFRANLEAILALARERGDPVLLTTFAYYLPGNYSQEAMLAHRLDYARHLAPVEMWGPPRGVTRTVNAHNAIVRDLAAHTPDVRFVDLARLMPASGRYYNDPCHLSARGCRAMAKLLLEHVAWDQLARPWKGTGP